MPNAFVVGATLYVRTTGEPVAVLSQSRSGHKLRVRRPVMTSDGVKHVVNTFLAAELDGFPKVHQHVHDMPLLIDAEQKAQVN